ncbi:Zn-ribbon domain-containing OB-fold protein [Rhodococcus sp. T7]|uniref:Zn-ribbon domain-containing OB-fold protein n=1 Tax=Rhodococcus sp. T7 TaxID=627444 RepID=UPI0013592A11|nr:OB-fold domain-containing protein [Rhodococcus sp. T7]KAF0960283.1 hypothetical protein MLGJGCBP_06675 [Rhodococcus sp. T7]
MTDFPTPVRSTHDSAEFFDAARQGRLLLRRCSACGTVRAPHAPVCPACHESVHSTLDADGTGTLVSWSVVHRSPLPDVTGPYVVGVVETREGPWLPLRLLCAEDTTLHAGQRVSYTSAPTGEDGEPIIAGVPIAANQH